jgi:hypothetical protein
MPVDFPDVCALEHPCFSLSCSSYYHGLGPCSSWNLILNPQAFLIAINNDCPVVFPVSWNLVKWSWKLYQISHTSTNRNQDDSFSYSSIWHTIGNNTKIQVFENECTHFKHLLLRTESQPEHCGFHHVRNSRTVKVYVTIPVPSSAHASVPATAVFHSAVELRMVPGQWKGVRKWWIAESKSVTAVQRSFRTVYYSCSSARGGNTSYVAGQLSSTHGGRRVALQLHFVVTLNPFPLCEAVC